MTGPLTEHSVTLDDLDRQILHSLQLSPRAPFARIAAVLGVSEQTVARRYQRMRTNGLVRVLARADPGRAPGTSSWSLRIGCRPGTAQATAEALARRTDTAWVSIVAGGAEIMCQVTVAEPSSGRESLLHHLPRASNVLTFTAHQVLHRFVGRGEADWVAVGRQLSPGQRAQLLADAIPNRNTASFPAASPPTATASPPTAAPSPLTAAASPPAAAASPPTAAASPPTAAASPPTAAASPPTAAASPPTAAASPPTAAASPPTAAVSPSTSADGTGTQDVSPAVGSAGAPVSAASRSAVELTPDDRALMVALAHDGRASYAALAQATGWSQRQVAHRLSSLLSAGAIYLDVDAAISAIGFRGVASLWFTVAPADLESVGNRLADHAELAWAAAVTGSANLTASAVCRDAQALYRYVTTKVAAIPEVRTLEIVPLISRVKQSHFLVENGLLRDPPL